MKSPVRSEAPTSPSLVQQSTLMMEPICAESDIVGTAASSEAAATTPPRPYSQLGLVAQRFKNEMHASAKPSTARPNMKSVQDNAILTAVRRQMEILEEKLGGQITRVQQQSDRLRDAAFSRVDSKMGTMEALQPKLDRRLAELSGNYKGLSDEMQTQIRRTDQMDQRLWEWRHQLEEEVHSKFTEIEQNYQQVSSALRLTGNTNDDVLKRYNRRLLRLEGLLEERLVCTEDTNQSIMNLHNRLSDLEQLRVQDITICKQDPTVVRQPDSTEMGDLACITALETRFADGSQKMEHLQQDSHDIHMQLEAQEERLKSLRTLIEAKDEHYRWLSDRVERADWENRFKDIHNRMQDHDQHKSATCEKLELLEKKLSSHQEEIYDYIYKLQDRANVGFTETYEPTIATSAAELAANNGITACFVGEEALLGEVKECMTRLNKSEAQLNVVTKELQSLHGDMDLAPRVTELVEQLHQVVPKVMGQEMSVTELHEKVGRLEVEVRMDRSIEGKNPENLVFRVGWLESEIARLKSEIETTGKPVVPGEKIAEALKPGAIGGIHERL